MAAQVSLLIVLALLKSVGLYSPIPGERLDYVLSLECLLYVIFHAELSLSQARLSFIEYEFYCAKSCHSDPPG